MNYKTKRRTRSLASVKMMMLVALLAVAPLGLRAGITGGHEWVDLGLPSGTLWATCNVGANNPWEYGDYFAWGETEPKDNYCADTYTYTHPSGQSELDSEHDAATVRWGDQWRMPSVSQFEELINSEYTTIEWITRNGIKGELITSKQNGEAIFMPCAGHRSYSSVEGIDGFLFSWYWSRTISTKYGTTYSPSINILYFNSYCYNCILESGGENGLPVRPVSTQTGPPVQLVTSITLSQTSLTINMGETQVLTATVLPTNASNKKVVWTSSDPNIASVDQTGMVTAVNVGICTITCSATDRSGIKTECRVTVIRNQNPDTNHEWVDLGLPSGTLWATCNIGASVPEEKGERFAWGELDPKEKYTWQTYKWCYGSYNTLTRYCCNSDFGYEGFTDNLTELLPEDDAATFNWGDEWRMPTPKQFGELANSDYVTKEYTTQNGANVWKFTSKSNGNSIIIPVAYGYWSRRGTLLETAYYFSTPSYDVGTDTEDRRYGKNIRPVNIQGLPSVQYVTNILLSENSLGLLRNESKVLTATVFPQNAADRSVTWTSSNNDVATVDQTGRVTAKADGTCVITCSATDGSGVKAECQVRVVSDNSGTINGRDYVDLGLPSGTLWATCNVGANSPEEFGSYFAWGETEPKTTYSWETYKYCNGSNTSLTKYCTKSDYGYNGFTDNNSELEGIDDAATAKWGCHWRLPSLKQIKELYDSRYTSAIWTTQQGVDGWLISGNITGKSIFLPAAAYYDGDVLMHGGAAGNYGIYLSRSLDTDFPDCADCIFFFSSKIYWGVKERCHGQSARPVLCTPVESLVLNQTQLSLPVGSRKRLVANVLPEDADDKRVIWASSDAGVATIEQTGRVTAVAIGTCTITCSALDGSGKYAECQVSVVQEDWAQKAIIYMGKNQMYEYGVPELDNISFNNESKLLTVHYSDNRKVEHDILQLDSIVFIDNQKWVDLGLPSGTLWATCNVGANNPEEYGDYFAWGETEPKDSYKQDTYFDIDESSTFKKYNNEGGLTELLPEDDAATANLGCSWQIPNYEQIEELCNSNYTTTTWTTLNGVRGYLITSKINGKSIFMPAAGYHWYDYLFSGGWNGCYWSRSLHTNSNRAYKLYFSYDSFITDNDDRYDGRSVRPVRVQGNSSSVLVTGITVSETSLSLSIGATQTLMATILPNDATNKSVIWSSSNTNVATVDQTGKVTALSIGTCDITCSAVDGSGVKAECQVTVTSGTTPDPGNHEWVDLGLPSGTLWATCNVGASSPEEYGDYFAWGETSPKSEYNWSTYIWCEGTINTMTKYCQQSGYGYNGFTDTLTELLPEDDAATANWGSSWQMPSLEQIQELLDNCTHGWTTQGGVGGILVTGSNGNTLFLPAAGCRLGTSLSNAGNLGYYWSRSLNTSYSYYAYNLMFNSSSIRWDYYSRYVGFTVRAVRCP